MSVLLAIVAAALIFQPGEGVFRKEAPRQTDGWLGLYCTETCALQPASLEYSVDTLDRDRLNAATRPRGAMLVFRDVPGLAAGNVPSVSFDGVKLFEEGFVPLVLHGEKYELRITAANRNLDKGVVTLKRGEVSQVVFEMPEFVEEGHLELRFAGDLDGDGKLDLIMSNSWKYSYSPVQLYLSSAARPGELVRLVAQWDSYGC